ncbi:hypothetical protein PR048_019532 [Dryococelus australis]|uniref:Tesmin/TSO1-like CXC domain-containing protein n=1 Tax=Dryococelus australis TaxID=614101 RepID=A0ABQ9H3Q6_9NEOP|nr:hypothetical protein PR048_019532 [Dryococelus australis]
MVSDNVAVIGEDVDLVVLLTALTSAEWEILFVKPSHGKTKTKIYSSKAPAKEFSLNLHCCHSFTQSVSNVKPDISALLSTEGAAKQHSFRVYHQVQLWLGNELPPELWEWGHKQNRLMPVTTEDPISPDSILNVIFCKCTTGCGGCKCGCRKCAINCTTICHNCRGECLNGISVTLDENEEVDDLEPLLEATNEDVNPEPSTSAVDKPVSRRSHQRKKQRVL